jgi:membrane-associated phospholipid phosphatase
MRRRILLSLFLILICESSLPAQNKYNFSQFTHETLDFVKQPGKWRGNDWLKLGLIGAGTFWVMQADQPIRDAVLRDRRFYHSVPIEGGRMWGEWYTTPVIAGAFGLHGWLTDNASSKKIGFEIVQAALYSEAITQIIKMPSGRARPYTKEGAFSYHPFTFFNFDFNSLPAGHVTYAFALSTVLSKNAHSGFVYLPTALTFISRVYQDYHWTSDCFLGAAIGYVVGSWVVNHHEQKESQPGIPGVKFNLIF